jgi:hypothetical protein
MTEPFIVAGPPRSGTSLVAGLLHRLGVNMGNEKSFLPANADNPTGYYEDSHFVFLNDAILSRADGTVWAPPPRSRIKAAGKHFSDEITRRLGSRESELPWGWKDPRNCLTLECYLSHCKPKVVVCNRDPLLIAESITKMNDSMDHQTAFNIATEYFERLISVIRTEGVECLIMHHELVIMEPRSAVSELLKFTGVEVDSDIVQNAVEFVIPSCR